MVKISTAQQMVFEALIRGVKLYASRLQPTDSYEASVLSTMAHNDISAVQYGILTFVVAKNAGRPYTDPTIYNHLKALLKKGLVIYKKTPGGTNRWWPVGMSELIAKENFSEIDAAGLTKLLKEKYGTNYVPSF